MTKVLSFFVLLSIALIVFISIDRCNTNPIVQYIPGDSIPYAVPHEVPKPYAVYYPDSIPVHDTLWLPDSLGYELIPIDTNQILRNYYAKVAYKDTLLNDSSALIVVNDTLNKNRIYSRDVMFQNRRKTAIINNEKDAVVLGAGINLDNINFSVGYKFKSNIVSLTYSKYGPGIMYQRTFSFKK
jgi:hypothetical protein